MAPTSPLRQLTRRVAFALTIALQLVHIQLQIQDRWGPPRKANAKMTVGAKLFEIGFISMVGYRMSEHQVDAKVGRVLVRGWGIEALFWGMVAWSALCVGWAVWVEPSLLGLVQLLVFDVLAWTGILSSTVGLVEREGAGDQSAVSEGVDEKGALKEKEALNGKEEV